MRNYPDAIPQFVIKALRETANGESSAKASAEEALEKLYNSPEDKNSAALVAQTGKCPMQRVCR